MKAKALEIRWHDTQPIFSADFHSISPEQYRKVAHPYALIGASSTDEGVEKKKQKELKEVEKLWRLATAGGDKLVRLWLVRPRPHLAPQSAVKSLVPSTSKLQAAPLPNFEVIGSPTVEFLAELKQHTGVVNCVRFSPIGETLATAGDDGNILFWIPGESVVGFGESAEDKKYEKEGWRVKSMLRSRSGQEIYDIAWSPDGSKILAGSVDHTANIYDVSSGQLMHTIAEHTNYVQGVAWDPRDHFIATQSSDRSMHIYSLATTPTGLQVHPVGKNARMEVKHKQGGSWSTSTNPKTITAAPEEKDTGKGKEKEVQQPAFQRASSRASDSDRSESSSTRPSLVGGTTDQPTTMEPPFRPSSSRNSSTSGSQTHTTSNTTIQNSPTLIPHSTTSTTPSGSKPSSSFRSPSPAPAPAVRYPPSPTLAPATAPSITSTPNEKINNVKLYGDANSTPFFRRLCWSTDGSLLLTPAGLFEDPYAGVGVANNEGEAKKNKRKNFQPTETGAGGPKPTVYIYSRSNVSKAPIAHLPGHKTTSIAIRFCPILWELRKLKKGGEGEEEEVEDEECITIDLSKEGVEAKLNGAGEEEEMKVDGAKEKAEEEEGERPASLFDLPYRMIYAVATLDSVYLYDTQQAGPICMFGNLHYAPFTDLSWSADGETLVVSSQDGYCSIVAFEPQELGKPYTKLGPHQAITFNHPIPSAQVVAPAPLAAAQTTLPGLFAAAIPPLALTIDEEKKPIASGSGSGVKREGEGETGEQPAKKVKKRAVLNFVGNIGGGGGS